MNKTKVLKELKKELSNYNRKLNSCLLSLNSGVLMDYEKEDISIIYSQTKSNIKEVKREIARIKEL